MTGTATAPRMSGSPWPRTLRLPGLRPHGDVVLTASGVDLRLGDAQILRTVDLQVRTGRVLALVGPNGAGKSTLLGVLAGDLVPDAGQVSLDGAPARTWSTRELAVRRGVLLQRLQMSFPFTVTEVVRMGRAPWASTSAEDWDDEVVAEAMRDTEVCAFGNRAFTTLSGGERARTGMARVLAQEPSLLLLDEPTAALDIRHQELMLRLIAARAARGDAVVVVMHDLALAAAHADEIAVLAAGRVAAVGPPRKVLTEALLSEVYQYPIEVLDHPRTGALIVVPRRDHRIAPDTDPDRPHPWRNVRC